MQNSASMMPAQIKSSRGMTTLATLFCIVAVAMVAYAVYDMALTNYRLSQRNDYINQAKLVADAELEYAFYLIKSQIESGTDDNGVIAALQAAGPKYNGYDIGSGTYGEDVLPSVPRQPYVTSLTTLPSGTNFNPNNWQNTATNGTGWTVRRSMSWIFRGSGTMTNVASSALKETVVLDNFAVKVEVSSPPTSPVSVDVKEGRYMSFGKPSVLDYPVFGQGDLEFSPSGTVAFNGSVAANGSVYMGSSGSASNDSLTVYANVLYLGTGTDPLTNQSYGFFDQTLINGSSINLPIFGSEINDNSGDTMGAEQTIAMNNQVGPMSSPIDLLNGNVDNVQKIATSYGSDTDGSGNPDALFGKVDAGDSQYNWELQSAENNIYRAVIVPPPSVVATELSNYPTTYTGADYPSVPANDFSSLSDDPNISKVRDYNQAGLIITVNPDNSATIQAGPDATPTQILGPGGTSLGSAGYDNVITAQKSMWDMRQGKTVAMTQINVGNLITALGSTSFNGLLYVYLANGTATEPTAVQLVNGGTTPNNASGGGFSVVTNGGIYVVGNYNTTAAGTTTANSLLNSDDSTINASASANPALLMGDQVTVLSSAWAGPGSTDSWGTNVVGPTAATNMDAVGTTAGQRIAASGTTTIAAGILTGDIYQQNTAGSPGYVYSGGMQNLIQFEEDWGQSSVNFYGSIGRLFQSTMFADQFQEPYEEWDSGTWNNVNTDGMGITTDHLVYSPPAGRFYNFNSSLGQDPPPGAPNQQTTSSRGTFFVWTN